MKYTLDRIEDGIAVLVPQDAAGCRCTFPSPSSRPAPAREIS